MILSNVMDNISNVVVFFILALIVDAFVKRDKPSWSKHVVFWS